MPQTQPGRGGILYYILYRRMHTRYNFRKMSYLFVAVICGHHFPVSVCNAFTGVFCGVSM